MHNVYITALLELEVGYTLKIAITLDFQTILFIFTVYLSVSNQNSKQKDNKHTYILIFL